MDRLDRIERDGTRLWFQDTGQGAPPLLLVHGWGADHSVFSAYVVRFRERHRVVAVDLRGHGASGAGQPGATMALLAEDLAWLCRQLGLYRPVVVGHRGGGLVALDLADRFPSVPGAVVLLDPPGTLGGEGDAGRQDTGVWLAGIPGLPATGQESGREDVAGFGEAPLIRRLNAAGSSGVFGPPVLVLSLEPAVIALTGFRSSPLTQVEQAHESGAPGQQAPPESAIQLIDAVLLRRPEP